MPYPGTCKDCGGEPEPGRSRCAEHLTANREREAARRARAKKRRACLVCGLPAARGKSYCTDHLEYYRQRQQTIAAERKAAGLCVVCGAETPQIYCEAHRRRA